LISLLIPLLISCSRREAASVGDFCGSNQIICFRGKRSIEMQTNRGKIIFELDGESAPVTVGNFLDLVNRGVYENTTFHRVIKHPVPFLIQGGDPNSKKSKLQDSLLGLGNFIDPLDDKPRFIPLEIKLKSEDFPRYGNLIKNTQKIDQIKLRHKKGSISMARAEAINSASAQFFISLKPLPLLDGRYSVFGELVKGNDVLDLIKEGDYIIKIKLLND
tara:strand:- start:126 stop:779 length:654 start_codon:yes stop_codon:yes gene_type:complete